VKIEKCKLLSSAFSIEDLEDECFKLVPVRFDE